MGAALKSKSKLKKIITYDITIFDGVTVFLFCLFFSVLQIHEIDRKLDLVVLLVIAV